MRASLALALLVACVVAVSCANAEQGAAVVFGDEAEHSRSLLQKCGRHEQPGFAKGRAQCVCNPGYEPGKGGCRKCERGTAKQNKGDYKCLTCTGRGFSPNTGRRSCLKCKFPRKVNRAHTACYFPPPTRRPTHKPTKTPTPKPTPKPSSVKKPPAPPPPRKDFRITFIHLNDVHGRVEPANSGTGPCTGADVTNGLCYGGFARMVAAVKAVKAKTTHDVIVLDAGDQFTGTTFDVVYKGQEAIPFQKLMNVQAMTLGNHEWDGGPAQLANFSSNPGRTYPLLACNVDASAEPLLANVIKPYTIITTASGIKVGVVGFTTPDTPFLSSPGPTIVFKSLYPSVQNTVNKVRALGVDIVVGLSHIGYEVDQQVANNVTGIDLIIGGHSHSFLYSNTTAMPLPVLNTATNLTDASNLMGPYPTIMPLGAQPAVTTPITTAFWASRYLGTFETLFDGRTSKLKSIVGNPILLGQAGSGSNTAADPEAQAVIDRLKPPVEALGLQVVGVISLKLEGDRNIVRSMETNLGDITADAMVASLAKTEFSQAGYGPLWIALTNGGGLRASIQGPSYPYNVTQNDILTVLPFGNYISVQLVTGQQLIDALENGVSMVETLQGRFPQVSGIKFGWSPDLPAGSRVIRTTARIRTGMTGAYTPIVATDEYPIASNNFIVVGGDGYTSIQAGTSIYESGQPLDQALADYISANSPVSQTTDGRIVNCKTTPVDSLCLGVP